MLPVNGPPNKFMFMRWPLYWGINLGIPHLLASSISTKTSKQASEQQDYYKDGEETHVYDNPDSLHNEIEMSPNVVYGAGDQKPSEIKMKKNQVYGL